MTLVPASDGYAALVFSARSQEKLWSIHRYLQIFCGGMKNKWTNLVYADLFAGPGKWISKETQIEAEGTALLAVRLQAGGRRFDRLFLNDRDPLATTALQARIGRQHTDRVRITTLDYRDAIPAARQFLFTNRNTLGVAVIDPFGLDMTYDALADLTRGVRLDLIITFMSDHIRRLLKAEDLERALDAFYGAPTWRRLAHAQRQGKRVTYGDLLGLYKNQLRKLGYVDFDESVRVKKSNGTTKYHLLYASKHPVGAQLFRRANDRSSSGQRRLF